MISKHGKRYLLQSAQSDDALLPISPLTLSSTDPLPHGYLYKQSKRIGVFRKRYIVVHHHKLYSYKSDQVFTQNQHQYTEVFDLRIYSKVEATVNKYYTKQFEFTIYSTTHSRRFRCHSECELRSWVHHLTSVQDHIKNNHLILHFAGIKPPKSCISTIHSADISTVITIQSSLTAQDTVFRLKHLIRNTYGISSEKDILILYSNTILSTHDHVSLQRFDVCNNSLLLLAIDVVDRDPRYTYVDDIMMQEDDGMYGADPMQCKTGFDIIMQEDDVLLYKMPCGHWMNRDSLYDYASSVFGDRHNTCLKCPHAVQPAAVNRKRRALEPAALSTAFNRGTYRSGYWSCPNCTYNNIMLSRGCVVCNFMRVREERQETKVDDLDGFNYWSCPQCTYHNPRHSTRCELCDGIKPAEERNNSLCNAEWKYPHIKKIWTVDTKENESAEDTNTKLMRLELYGARNMIENECNVQKCADCDTLYVRKNEEKDGEIYEVDVDQLQTWRYKTQCIVCVNSFCWFCGAKWEADHCCDAIKFKCEFLDILKTAGAKKIGDVRGVPSIRCCPNCCQLIKHSNACKHMNCSACKTEFCFVCLKMKKNERWQCGNSSSICPVAPRQNSDTLPANKKIFKLF